MTAEQAPVLAATINKCCKDLRDILPDAYRPSWIEELRLAAMQHGSNKSKGIADRFNQYLVKNYHQIQPIKFMDPTKVNLDSIFEQARDSNELPELFDKMAAQLEAIIKTNKVDSSAVLAALNKMIDLLRANRKGSYTSIVSTRFAARFLWNMCKTTLENIPGVAVARETFEELQNEDDAVFRKVEEETQKQTITKILANTEVLERLAMLPMEESDRVLLARFTPVAMIEDKHDELV